jgi:hypothetical protein
MRRTLGFIAVALGAFLIAAAPLVKWYLAPRATRIPLDQYSVSTSVSDGQSVVLDKGKLLIRKGLTLTNRQVVQGTGGGDGRTAVWESLTRLADADGALVSATKEKVALDRVSAMAVRCCDEQLDGVATEYQGLTFKFPFDTGRHDYPFFDTDTKRAWPMVYAGEEHALGLTLYHFVQTVPATDVETLEAPKSLLGLPGEGSQAVHRYYQNVTDVLVEPVTGIIVRRVAPGADPAGRLRLVAVDRRRRRRHLYRGHPEELCRPGQGDPAAVRPGALDRAPRRVVAGAGAAARRPGPDRGRAGRSRGLEPARQGRSGRGTGASGDRRSRRGRPPDGRRGGAFRA